MYGDRTQSVVVWNDSSLPDGDYFLRSGVFRSMLGIYNYMTSALLLTAIVAYFAANTPAVMNAMYVVHDGRVGLSGLGWIAALAPLAFVMFFSFRLQAMSFATAQGVSGLRGGNGPVVSSLLLATPVTSIARSFFVTAIVFGSMSLYGYATKRDLTGMGSFLMMGLWGIILASLVNMFLHSAGMEFILSILCVIVFTGLTAYDTQNLKAMYYQVQGADRDIAGQDGAAWRAIRN